jgi:hypothetical protein
MVGAANHDMPVIWAGFSGVWALELSLVPKLAVSGLSGDEKWLDRIMGWAPRTVRERHYIRVAPQAMHDAIQTLYRDDPICAEQIVIPAADLAETPVDRCTSFAREIVRLAALEREFGMVPA